VLEQAQRVRDLPCRREEHRIGAQVEVVGGEVVRLRESAVMISSTMPSAKYSCSGSPPIFVNGNTAIDGLSGKIGGDLDGAAGFRSASTTPMKRRPLRGTVRINR
jgi:hypothetical protein